MKEQPQNIRDKQLYRFASAKRYLKIHVPDFAFKHDDNNVGKDKFVGREIQIRKLYTWLTSDSKSGSYLITGYRGMGKSLLVKRVIDMISREPKAYKEVMFQVAMIMTIAACLIGIVVPITVLPQKGMIILLLAVATAGIVTILELSKAINLILFEYNIRKVPSRHLFDKDMIAKVWLKNKDRRSRKYSNIHITVNLGQEILHERDVLSLIAQNLREKYYKYVHNRQTRPIISIATVTGSCILAFCLTRYLILPVLGVLIEYIVSSNSHAKSWVASLLYSTGKLFGNILYAEGIVWMAMRLLFYLFVYHWFVKLLKSLRKKIPYFSVPFKALERLNILCDRISSSLNEEQGAHPQYSSGFLNFSFGKEGKSKLTPKATVRELEHELLGIINSVNSGDCPPSYKVQFIIVFDELDKITKASHKNKQSQDENEEEALPEFDTSVKGFTDAMAYEERKQNVLRLLANMKLFIATVKAKCVFISGHELFDASLADLSDREFAISSIFNGVLNVSSFLSPEREESDVSSMTEVYLATMLLPETELKRKIQDKKTNEVLSLLWSHLKEKVERDLQSVISFWPIVLPKSYLRQKVRNNIQNNSVLKDELPSLRWYNEYLMEEHILKQEDTLTEDEIMEREKEIRHVMEFLRNFCVYLSHISNGSPKKIASYFEKYVKVNFDTVKQFDWYDEIEVGFPTEEDVRKQCVLYFDPSAQKLVNFVHYIAAPVMNAITNEVSHYGDKLLVSSSFILDQIYKYHGKGFSWRNLEQMPELLTLNKNPELRDSMASIMEFLLQTHITTISSSIFQYKFHKQIAEEISMLSKTSEEAAAIFNFTLNESETVKRYNTRLLRNYLNLTNQTKDKNQRERYCDVLERLHENQGDIYFSEEDYYRAIHEYRSALQYIDEGEISPRNLIAYLKCSLKIGMSYEYRHTFENAYMVYCQIINKLVQLRWMEESKFGLDYTMRLTHDWRVKQNVLVDAGTLRGWYSNERNAELRRHFKPGLVEDLREYHAFKPEYSIDADQTISELAKNFTPEKSELFLRLTVFEDVKFIYQAIIAKLFVIEKMESSGITQSSIDAAEAQFMALYSITNYKEKYIMASNFFSKLASILYYKNAIVTSEIDESIYTTLYLFDIDLLALIDDYCYNKKDGDAYCGVIQVKDDLRNIFTSIKTSEIMENCGEGIENLSDLNKILEVNESLLLKTRYLNKERERSWAVCKNVYDYLKYIDGLRYYVPKIKWRRLKDCYDRRTKLNSDGFKLPCTACKYANRSLVILMKQLFNYDESEESKVITLLSNASHQNLKNQRPEILSQLAASSEQLADIMMSCSYTVKEKKMKNDTVEESMQKIDTNSDCISVEAIKVLVMLTKKIETIEWNEEDGDFYKKLSGKLDRSILYYWAACRYYDIASMHHEAVHCIWRITNVIEKYLSVRAYYNNRYKIDPDIDALSDNLLELLNHLFRQASIIVGRQYDNFNSVEIHEFKWLFHLEHVDDIDLTKLTQFPDLQSIFMSIVNCKLYLHHLMTNNYNHKKEEYVSKMYLWHSRYRHEHTFKSEVELNYQKVKLNHAIFISIMDGYDVKQDYFIKENEDIGYYYPRFYNHLRDVLGVVNYHNKIGKQYDNYYIKSLFKINRVTCQSVMDILDFLIYDSITCLCNIIGTFPPHNQFTSFSNSYIAEVYEDLWDWSKYYAMMYDIYLYYRYFISKNVAGMKKMERYFPKKCKEEYSIESMKQFAILLNESGVKCEDNFGYKYSKLFMNLRHDIDDATLHHILIDYSAEMAISYYRAARGINSEGLEYKNMINNMYILDDDLSNDTCQSNIAVERYLLNSGVINQKRDDMQSLYRKSKVNTIDSYEGKDVSENDEITYHKLLKRYTDSNFLNTDY
jgi:hypothetical protein